MLLTSTRINCFMCPTALAWDNESDSNGRTFRNQGRSRQTGTAGQNVV
jgi:hypothetical protein